MNKTTLTKTGLFVAALFSASTFAHTELNTQHCEIKLNYDLAISPEHIRIIDNDQTLVDIYQDKQVFIKGEMVTLTPQEQTLINTYSDHIRRSIPEVSQIATEAVSIAYQGISAALGSQVNLDKTKAKFDQLQQKIEQEFNNKQGHYSFRQGNFSTSVDNHGIDEMVEEIVEEMVPQLIGSLMINLGSAMANGDTDFSQFDGIDDKIEQEIESRAEVIEQKAEAFCQRLTQANEVEQQLIANNKLQHLDLLKVN